MAQKIKYKRFIRTNENQSKMKKTILILFLAIGITAQAQESNSHNLTLISAGGAYNDGFNYGVQYEYQMGWPYAGAEVFHFPDLHEISYTHLILRAGIGQEYGNPVGNKWRWNVGFRGGRVFRQGYDGPFALIGLEVGAQLTLPFGLLGKLVYGRDTKSDAAIWNEDNHTVNSVFAGIGYRF